MRKTEVMTKLKRNERGITLIALVITIIVLLILAGVAISMLSGENGILRQAAESKIQNEKASTEEALKIAAAEALTLGKGKLEGANAFEVLNTSLIAAGYNGEIITEENLPKTVEINKEEYLIKETGEVEKIESVTNPYDSNGWDIIYTYTASEETEGVWSDAITDKTTDISGANIVAKYYSTEKALVLEGTGEMGALSSTDGTIYYAWQKSLQNGEINIEKAIICEGITNIGNYAFTKCANLKSVKISKSIESIGVAVFRECININNIVLPGVTDIANLAFQKCSSLEKFTAPKLEHMDGMLFPDCIKLKSISMPELITTGVGIFRNCSSLESANLPKLESLRSQTFYNCQKLKDVNIPKINSIGAGVFTSCYSLTNIVIPAAVTSIETNAFGSCTNLKDIYYKGTEEQWSAIVINDKSTYLANATIHYNS